MGESVKSLERAFKVLEKLGVSKDGVGITDLAKDLGMHKSTIHRVLSTLVGIGYVEQNVNTEKYRLGYKLLEISSQLLNNQDIRRDALPYLHELAELTNEVVHLVLLDQGQVVYIDKVEGTETIRMHSRIGTRVPAHCTGVGKAMMAYLSKKQVENIVERYGLTPHTPFTITTAEELHEKLKVVEEQGYALDLEENEIGINCVAAPIWDYKKQVFAAVSVSGPKMRMHDERLMELAPKVKEIGLKISRKLGHFSQIQ